jgi:outer membrane protein assembly factor BamB
MIFGNTSGVRALVAGFVAAALLSGCADSLPSLPKLDDLNPFKEKIPPLPGKRISVLPKQDKVVGELADASNPIMLPPPRVNDSWAQPGGDPNNAPGHLMLATSVRQAWTADAGKGSSKVGRVTASPIVYDGRVYTLDANGMVRAFSMSGGSPIWTASLAPTVEKKTSGGFSFPTGNIFALGADDGGAYGGGLAADGGRIYAASGLGTVVALDPGSGKRLWEKQLGAPVRSSPTTALDRIFVVTSGGRSFCLSAIDGTELWAVRGLPQQASLVLNSSPAVEGDVVVVPYPSGDVVALKVLDGSAVWSENLARNRTTSQLTSLSDAARPVIDGGTVFAIGHGGRMVATNAVSGDRIWSLNLPGTQAPWVAGESVFIVDTAGQVMALTRREGKIQWTTKLPGGGTWSGPILAGGVLWLTSSKGQLAGIDATTGRVTGSQDLGDPVFIAPVVAQGRMFVLTDNAKLISLN